MLNLRSKRVLVVDDFITNGRSLDTARAYIEAAKGAEPTLRAAVERGRHVPRAVQRSIHDTHCEDCTDAAEGDAMPSI